MSQGAAAPPAFWETVLHLLCHDFRVPLTSFGAYAELLGGAELPEEQRLLFLNALQVQAGRLARMVDDLESLAHVRDQTAAPAPAPSSPGSPFEVREAIQAVAEDVLRAGTQRGVQVICHPGTDLLHSPADGGCLARALAWVLEAGLRRGTPGQSIEVRAEAAPQGNLLHVRVDLPVEDLTDEDLAGLRTLGTSASPPDLVRGIAGPLAVSLWAFAQGGARYEIARGDAGLRWTFVLPGTTD